MNKDVSRRTFLGAAAACAAAATTGCGDITASAFFQRNFRDMTPEEKKAAIARLEAEA